MKPIFGQALTLISLLSLAACGGGSGGSSGSPANQTPGIDGLTADLQGSFENWKKRPLKSCSVSDVFGMTNDRPSDDFGDVFEDDFSFPVVERSENRTGIDIGYLLAQNNQSAIININSESFIISQFTPFSGFSVTINVVKSSDGTDIDLKTESSGATCKIFSKGKEIYKTTLAQNISVKSWSINNSVRNKDLSEDIATFFTIEEAGLKAVAKHLGLTDENYKKFIRPDNLKERIIVREKNSLFWANLSDADLAPGKIEVRFKAPVLNGVDEVLNPKEQGNFAFEFDLKPTLISLRSFDGIKKHDEGEASSCISSRMNNSTYRLKVQDLISPCVVLHPNIYEIGIENERMNKLAVAYYKYNEEDVGGWKILLKEIVMRAVEQGKDIQAIDPFNDTSDLVKNISQTYEVLLKQLEVQSSLSYVKDDLLNLAFDWGYAKYSINEFERNVIILSKVSSVFTESSKTVILYLNPTSYSRAAAIKALAFANQTASNKNYQEAALKAYERNKNFAATFHSILTSEPSLESIKDMIKGRE